jgi:hypothetical protein
VDKGFSEEEIERIKTQGIHFAPILKFSGQSFRQIVETQERNKSIKITMAFFIP